MSVVVEKFGVVTIPAPGTDGGIELNGFTFSGVSPDQLPEGVMTIQTMRGTARSDVLRAALLAARGRIDQALADIGHGGELSA